MKRIGIIKITVLAVLSLVFAISCNKTNEKTGYLRVKMTDAPGDFDSVFVDIQQVQVHISNNVGNSGWVDLNTNAGVYNLLELQNDITTVLADTNVLPVGDLQQMRLILGSNNSVVIDSLTYPLELTSQTNTGLKLNINTTISPNDLVEVLIDFDAAASIVETGQGKYILKPVIKVESINYL
ncbi:MAG: DUF4382 domain-containing protein [bacterium]|nr:DUF4382 domain-containing protein [bacterium]